MQTSLDTPFPLTTRIETAEISDDLPSSHSRWVLTWVRIAQ